MVWGMFVDISNVLLLRPKTAETAFPKPAGRALLAGNFEMVAAVSPQGEISISPALRVLPSGQYSLSVMKDGLVSGASTSPAAQPLDWNSAQPIAKARVGETGLYRIRVMDQAYVPRIEVEVLATSPAAYSDEATRLKQVRETVLGWSHTYDGWPLHPFLRVYLESRSNALFS
jgi:hypothetical protein